MKVPPLDLSKKSPMSNDDEDEGSYYDDKYEHIERMKELEYRHIENMKRIEYEHIERMKELETMNKLVQ